MSIEEPATAPAAHTFKRSLSGFGVIILTLSVLSPGVSILISGASIVQQAGTGVVLAFLIGALSCYCQTALITELGAAYPSAGYDSAAMGHALGDWAGATFYISGILGIPLFLNVSAGGIATYLHPLGLHADDNTVTLVTVAVVTALAMLNIRTNEYITGVFLLIEFAALLLVAGVGAAHVHPEAARLVLQPIRVENGAWIASGVGVVALAVNTASWTLGGAAQGLLFSEEMKRPQTIARIIMIAFILTIFLETAPIIGVIFGAKDLKAVLGPGDPFQIFLGEYVSDAVLKFVSLSIAVAIFNAALAGFIGFGRYVFSLGRTRLFAPVVNKALTQVMPATDAPWFAILLTGAATALATFLPLTFKLLILSSGGVFATGFYALSVFVGRRRGKTGVGTYRTPLFPLLPILGAVVVIGASIALWSDPDIGRKSLLISLCNNLLGFAYYRFVLMRRPERWTLVGPKEIDDAVSG